MNEIQNFRIVEDQEMLEVNGGLVWEALALIGGISLGTGVGYIVGAELKTNPLDKIIDSIKSLF